MNEFTADTLIRDVLIARPDAADVLERHGFACTSCLAAAMESISAAAAMHDVPLAELLADLNGLPTPSEEE